MREGYWINFRARKTFLIDEHESWLRTDGNAELLGVPKKVIRAFLDFKPVRDRERFLLFVMQHAPVMRVRGHGIFVTFEYAARKDGTAVKAIGRFARRYLGPMTELNIVNLARIRMPRQKFHDARHGVENP